MSLLSVVEHLKCIRCPFIKNYKCFLDSTLDLSQVCDNEKVHIDCQLLAGKVVVVRAENGNLIIGVDYD